jgi:hypothetical protein
MSEGETKASRELLSAAKGIVRQILAFPEPPRA